MEFLPYKALKRLAGQIYIDVNSDYHASVLITGSGRSGTTWIAEVLNASREFRYIFEPLHPSRHFRSLGAPDIGFVGNGANPDDRIKDYIDDVIKGNCRGLWMDKYNTKHLPKRRIIKEVRANLFLGWIKDQYPEMPLIHVLRNPYCVVGSQMKGYERNNSWNPSLEVLSENEELLRRLPSRVAGCVEVHKELSLFSRMFLRWVIENYIAISDLSDKECRVVIYDGMRVMPGEIFRQLYSYLSLDWSQSLVESIKSPSSTARKKEAVSKGEDYLESIKGSLDGSELKRLNELLSTSGFSYFLSPVKTADAFIFDKPAALLS